ncbi:hypothetical protein HanRHA438_Chr07g0325021 [Helianthus annuus]|nr:hypothetical protein HanRHA438_Chr07g0325021 [Helianthus annuus]
MPFALSSLPLQNTTPHTAIILSSLATTRRHTAARSPEPLQPPHAAPSITQTISSGSFKL